LKNQLLGEWKQIGTLDGFLYRTYDFLPLFAITANGNVVSHPFSRIRTGQADKATNKANSMQLLISL